MPKQSRRLSAKEILLSASLSERSTWVARRIGISTGFRLRASVFESRATYQSSLTIRFMEGAAKWLATGPEPQGMFRHRRSIRPPSSTYLRGNRTATVTISKVVISGSIPDAPAKFGERGKRLIQRPANAPRPYGLLGSTPNLTAKFRMSGAYGSARRSVKAFALAAVRVQISGHPPKFAGVSGMHTYPT